MKIWLTDFDVNVQFHGVKSTMTGEDYTHTNSIPAPAVKEEKPVSHDLTSTNLLKQCLLGKI